MTQDEALTIMTLGKNVFLTGAPGSGKSYVLRRYIEWLRERGIEPTIIAPTGLAASHLNGLTVHAWAGIGRSTHVSAYDVDRIASTERVVLRMRDTRVLIIDEVSMLSAQLFETVDRIVRAALQSNKVFGGWQVVLCGDFFQLPPHNTNGERVVRAFDSSVWRALTLSVCYLTEQHRIQHDGLLRILHAMRSGVGLDEARSLLMSRIGRIAPDTVPGLFPHNSDVAQVNEQRLAAMPGPAVTFTARGRSYRMNQSTSERGLGIPKVVTLKQCAEVIFTQNDPEHRYINGTQGFVQSFVHGIPEVRTRSGTCVRVPPTRWQHPTRSGAYIEQVPLRLAWALTIHKSQGMTLDAARMDLSRAFIPEQGYVAVSRVRTLDALYLEGFNDAIFACSDRVRALDRTWQDQTVRVQQRLHHTSTERIQTVQDQHVHACVRARRTRVTPDGAHTSTPRARLRTEALHAIASVFADMGSWSVSRAALLLNGTYSIEEIEQARALLREHMTTAPHSGEADTEPRTLANE